MKPTLRKNGKMMVTRRVEFHLSLKDIAKILRASTPLETLRKASRAQLEKRINNNLQWFGEESIQDVSDEEIPEFEKFLSELAKKFPEFKAPK